MFDLIAPQEAADILGVSTERVRQFALRGALPPAVTTGGRRLYRREDVQALADRRRADAFWTGERGSWASRASLAVSTIGTLIATAEGMIRLQGLTVDEAVAWLLDSTRVPAALATSLTAGLDRPEL